MTAAERQARRRARKGKSINRRRRTLYKLKKTAPARKRREALRNGMVIPDGMDLRIGDARIVLADIADDSVPLILTDPPYGNAAEPLYSWLAQFAARVLVPGGSLICYTGQALLLRDAQILSEHLRYWWTFAMLHHQAQRFMGKFVCVEWKPALWFVKDERRGRSLLPDVLRPARRDKSLHEWSQGDGGIAPLIEHLTDPGEMIIDPFAGSTMWGKIAHSLGRRWIGADIVHGGSTTIKFDDEADDHSGSTGTRSVSMCSDMPGDRSR
jgi:hypothetical protein